MIVIAIISLLIGVILVFYIGMALNLNNKKSTAAPLLFVSVMIGTGALSNAIYDISPDEPTAIDVYRGRTTLRVIYQDSIAIDSIVVYKK